MKVDRRGPDECWPWLAALQGGGYGVFWMDGTQHPAHRIAFLLANGREAVGQVDHVCHNRDVSCFGRGGDCPHRRCMNPAHLRDATASENQRGGRNRCHRGHLWTELGVTHQIDSKGFAHCYICMNERRAEKRRTEGKRENRPRGSDTCRNGHDLTDPANRYDTGKRVFCRACQREGRRAKRAARVEALSHVVTPTE